MTEKSLIETVINTGSSIAILLLVAWWLKSMYEKKEQSKDAATEKTIELLTGIVSDNTKCIAENTASNNKLAVSLDHFSTVVNEAIATMKAAGHK